VLYSAPPAGGYQLSGLRSLLLCPWSGAALYSYDTPARSTITNFSGLTGWQRIPCGEGEADFSETGAPGKLGTTYAQAVQVTLAGLSAARRTAAEALLQSGPVLALCQGMDGVWWLYGQDRGLRLTATAAKSATLTLPLAGIQSEAARVVASSRINLFFNSATTFLLP
jgi:hypothetical protein